MEEANQRAVQPQSTPARVGVAGQVSASSQASASPHKEEQMALPIKVTPLESRQSAGPSDGRHPTSGGSADVVRHAEPPAAPPAAPSSAFGSLKAGGHRPSADGPAIAVQEAGPPADTDIELPDLSPEQIAFLSSKRYAESDAALKREFGLSDEDLSFLNEMDHAVFGGLINLPQYAAAIGGEFPNLNRAEKDRMIAHLLAYRFLPFGDRFSPGAEQAARDLRLKLPKTPYYRVYSDPLTYMGAAHELSRAANIALMGQAQERLRDIILSRVKNVRTDAQVTEQLGRSADMGGLGLKSDHARAAADIMNDIIGRARLVTEEEYSRALSDKIRGETDERPSHDEPVTTPEREEEDREIAEIAANMPKADRDHVTVLSGAVDAIFGKLLWRPEGDYLRRRLMNMISTRLRDVRTRNEFFMKLMRPVKVGGLGLDRERAERVTKEVEEGYAEFRGKVEEEEKSRLARQLEAQERKIEERRRREQEEHARWFEERIKSKREGEGGSRPSFKAPGGADKGGAPPPVAHPVEIKAKARERAAYGELVPVRPRAKPEHAGADQKPSVGRVTAVPPKPAVKVSMDTARMARAAEGARPRIEDVRVPGGARLAGPLQEIGSMTLEQFRRLGTPGNAARRIAEKVELLGEESFEKRVSGVLAWQESPLQKTYLGLLAQAFKTQKTMKALIDEKRKTDPNVMSIEEMEAIVALNDSLRL
jgi:hypothetical protein